MKIRILQGVELTQNQMIELSTLLRTPDMGWDKDCNNEPIPLQQGQYYDVKSAGDYAVYSYRVNLSYQLITIMEVI